MTSQQHLKHGDAETRLETAPNIGRRFEGKGLSIDLVKRCTWEVNFCTDVDVLTLCEGLVTGDEAFDSDKTSRIMVKPFGANFHPAGSATFVRTDRVDGDFIALSMDRSFRATLADEIGRPDLAGDLCTTPGMLVPQNRALFNLLHRFMTNQQQGGTLVAESLSMLVLSAVLERLADGKHGTPSAGALAPRKLQKLYDYIEDALAEDVGLNDLAKAVDLTPHHFSRAFKVATGLSPHQYVVERRITRAREMLETGTHPLADVAYATGFSSQAHMTDVFRRKLGVTPGAYRRDRVE